MNDLPIPNQFHEVAAYYDELMSGVPYPQWIDYLEEVFERFGASPVKMLDLACGTGRVSRLLAMKGYSVVGVDASAEMIAQAEQRPLRGVRYKCERMESLGLRERFDAAVCLFDSLNYLLDPRDVASCFARVREHLNAGGLFVFDVNTERAFELELFTQSNIGGGRSLEYRWESRFDRQTRLCTVDMRFYARDSKGRTREFHEQHVQRAYSLGELERLLRDAGLEPLGTFQAFTFRPSGPRTDRAHLVARVG